MRIACTAATASLIALLQVSMALGQPQPAPQTMRATYQVAPAHREAVDAEDAELSGPCVPEGWTIIDGDILMPLSSLQRGCHVTNLWPGGVVPYVFASNISAEVEAAFLLAMAEWEAVADVLFVERGSQSNYVVIQDHEGYPNSSNSAVGCTGGRQVINAGANNGQSTFAHELGHCLGLFHEQSRTDRDEYVYIHLDRVSLDACGGFPCWFNFTIESFSSLYGPYDFDSIMHYRQCTFSACDDCSADIENCRTISVQPDYEEWQDRMGASHPSPGDARIMSFLYPETNWRFIRLNGNDTFNSGSFISPWQSFERGYTSTPVNGLLWIADGQTISGARTLSRAVAIRAGNGPVVFR